MPNVIKADATEKLFGGANETAVEKSQRRDRYMIALANEPWARVDNMGRTVAGNVQLSQSEKSDTGTLLKLEHIEDASARLRSLLADDTINKALGTDQIAGIQAALATTGDIQKDISLSSPIAANAAGQQGLVLYDLHGPAEELVPIDTPLRNSFPRTQGVGTSFQYKQITGFTNAQTGSGLPLIHPGITDTTQTNFNVGGAGTALAYNRPPKISYTGQNLQAAYFQFGLSDEVTWSSFFAGQGFQDVRQLSQTSTMYASFLGEERMTAYGRGTSANGYSGAVAAPASVAVTVSATGGTIPAGTTYFVGVATLTGFGTSTAVWSASTTTTGSTSSLAVAWPSVPGALGYQVFLSRTAATAATSFFVGTAGSYAGVFTNATTVTSSAFTVTSSPTAGATPPTTDQSAQASGYDGILPITMGPSAGYTKNLQTTLDKLNPGSELQAAFAAQYALNLANPDRVMLNALDRKQQSDTIKSVGNPNGYRITMDMDSRSGRILGEIVTGIQNESTGKEVDLQVHPYWLQGTMSILTDTLPFPNSNVPSCWEYRNVQDYMGIDWPTMQLSYDFSTYWYGTFFCHAPAWQASITGIQAG
jgi:hypothetical protein